MADRLAGAFARFRWLVLVGWLVLLSAAGVAAIGLPDRLSGGGWYVPGSESRAAVTALQSDFASRGASNLLLVVRDDRYAAGSAEFDARVTRTMTDVVSDRRLASTGAYGWLGTSDQGRGRFVGADGHTAITAVGLRLDDGTARRILPGVQHEISDRYAAEGLRVALVSAGTFWGEINTLSQEGLTRAELIAFPLILLILLWLYRGVLATAISFVVSLTALGFTFGALSLLARQLELSIFVQNAATMMGLGVSVDYSLILISRYREELRRGHDRRVALAATLRTSGETVLLAGGVVVLAVCSLFLIDLNVIRSIALGTVIVVVFAVLASLLVLPVVLYLLGDRLRPRRGGGGSTAPGDPAGPDSSGAPGTAGPPEVTSTRWYRFADRVMRRPIAFLATGVVVLLALAAPALDLRTFTPDARILPAGSPVRFGFDALRDQFGQGTASPIQVVVTSGAPLDAAGAAAVLSLRDRLATLEHVRRVDSAVEVLRAANPGQPFAALADPSRLPPDGRRVVDHYVAADRRTAVLEVIADDYASSESTRALLGRVRSEAGRVGGGLRAVVGGETAEGVDANAVINDGLPLVMAVILIVTYLLLLLTFRSVLLPVKAIAMNLLSVAATYGVLVLVFQYGLPGMQTFGYLQNFVPILLLAILFSLSTDYEVFLLQRVREEYRAGADNAHSVALGMARTAPLISGAAILMVAVFGAFTFTGILPIQQLGFGLAVAIALDATLIRLIIVPASMRLLGRWNWWLPGRRSAPPTPVQPIPQPVDARD